MSNFVSERFKERYGGGVVQAIAGDMLASGLVSEVLAFTRGLDDSDIVAVFIDKAEDTGRIVTTSYYPYSLARLARDYVDKEERLSIVVRSCDARAVIELAKRNQVDIDKIYMIGIECYGVAKVNGGIKDPLYILPDWMEVGGEARALREELIRPSCLRCEYPVPTMADVSCHLYKDMTSIEVNTEKGQRMLSSASSISPVKKEAKRDVKAIDGRAIERQEKDFGELRNMPPGERLEYWFSQFDKCIKCYGCRNVCPICFCKDCILGAARPLVKGGELPPERMFHLVRLAHVADSCLNCGQCEAVCPMEIPLSKLFHMLHKELSAIFNYESGFDVNALPPLGMVTEEELTRGGVDLD